ncbi:zinc finger protein 385B-like [Phycodurus eques]|uniref:zinc finger protein 385B-like n=1 Tax=Phycodurus eques TaxID=693459 RepID=UPI002ACEB91F|nr:zinc finger protein 385B-like [Phycodurus eques]
MKTAFSSSYSVCVICNLQMTSAAQAQLHLTARSHLRRLRNIKAQAPGSGPPTLFPQALRLPTANHNSAPLSSNSGGNRSTRRKATQARGEHANSTQARPDLNPGPQNYEADVLTSRPPCHLLINPFSNF